MEWQKGKLLDFGKLLNHLENEVGVTTEDLAYYLMVTPSAVRRWFRVNNVPPSRLQAIDGILSRNFKKQPLSSLYDEDDLRAHWNFSGWLRDKMWDCQIGVAYLAYLAQLPPDTLYKILREREGTEDPRKGTRIKIFKALNAIVLDIEKERQVEENLVSLGVGGEKAKAYAEGSVNVVFIDQVERDSRARAACLQHYGYSCVACGMDFEGVYGGIGRGYIQVHHLVPLSKMKGLHEVDPVQDLVPVCPNCHAMLHYGVESPRSIDELKILMTHKGIE